MNKNISHVLMLTFSVFCFANSASAQFTNLGNTNTAISAVDIIEFSTSSNERQFKGRTTNGMRLLANDGSMTGSNAGAEFQLIGANRTCTTGTCPNMARIILPGNRLVSGLPNTETAFDILQYNNGAYDPSFTILKSGYTGIGGVYNFTDKLTVNGDIGFQQGPSNLFRSIFGRAPNSGLFIAANTTYADGATLVMNGTGTTYPGLIRMVSTGNRTVSGAPNSELAFDFMQHNGGTYPTLFSMNKYGNIGINTPPDARSGKEYRLSIAGNILLKSPYDNLASADRGLVAETETGRLTLFSGTTSNDGSWMVLGGKNSTQSPGNISFWSYKGSASDNNQKAFSFGVYDASATQWEDKMTIDKRGNVAIGSTIIAYGRANMNDYKLFVETGILTEKVRVAISTTAEWSDYVFADNYKLRSLNEVESFISNNKHLPDVPSAKQVVENGVDLGKMDAKLLQKIEELTLYVIQQQKDIEQLKKELRK